MCNKSKDSKQSFCSLEADVWPLDILNRLKLHERPLKALVHLNSNNTKAPDQEAIVKLVPSLETIWVLFPSDVMDIKINDLRRLER